MLLSPVIVPGAVLSSRQIGGALLGFGGAAVLITGGRIAFQTSALPGYALALAAAVIWSTYSLWTKRLAGVPTSAVATFCLVSGCLSLGCHFVLEPRYVPTASEVPYLLWIGVGPMGIAFYLWDRAMKRGDSRTIGTLAYLTPLLSTLLIAALGEGRLTATSFVALVMIVGGAAIGTVRARDDAPVGASKVEP